MTSATHGKSPSTVRVLTWNIHAGIGPDGRFDLERVAALVRRWQPDVVALKEVDSRRCAKGDIPAFAFLLKALGNGHAVEAKSILAQDGEYGQMLFSRWAMDKTAIHDISVPGREPRRAIEAEVATPYGPLHVVAVHLGLSLKERRNQAARLAAIAGRGARASIILGDFNDWIWAGSVQQALAGEFPDTTSYRTFPARWPLVKLDRVFCRPRGIMTNSFADRAGAAVSDHLPVIADLAMG